MILQSLEVEDVDGVEDDANEKDTEEGEGQGDSVDYSWKHADAKEDGGGFGS